MKCLEYDVFVLLPLIWHVKPGLMFFLMDHATGEKWNT